MTYNNFDYYNTSSIFIENPHPTYIQQADRKIDLKVGFPLNRNTKVTLNTAFINNSDRYSPNDRFAIGDILDKTIFNGSRTTFAFEQYTFNRKQYASRGRHFLLSLNYFTGRENYTPGNITANATQNAPPTIRTDRHWLKLKISDENYFFHSGRYSAGYLAEGVYSNMPLFSNYYSTLLFAPAFYPLQDSRSLFLENFRAISYLAGGIKNSYMIRKNLDIRAEAYVFLPYQKFEKNGFQNIGSMKPLSKWQYAATAGMVYHTPVGPISLSYNIYDDPIKRNGILLHLGYLIYNKRSIE